MPRDRLEVTFTCPVCGGTQLELPDNYTDASMATCKACHRDFGRLGDVRRNAVNMGRVELSKKAHDPMKGFGKRR